MADCSAAEQQAVRQPDPGSWSAGFGSPAPQSGQGPDFWSGLLIAGLVIMAALFMAADAEEEEEEEE